MIRDCSVSCAKYLDFGLMLPAGTLKDMVEQLYISVDEMDVDRASYVYTFLGETTKSFELSDLQTLRALLVEKQWKFVSIYDSKDEGQIAGEALKLRDKVLKCSSSSKEHFKLQRFYELIGLSQTQIASLNPNCMTEEGQDCLEIIRQMTESFPKRFIVSPLEYT